MEKVTSKDGSQIAYDRLGSGPAVILVCGGSVDRKSNAHLAEELSHHFTVYNYDRRGRGDSGDNQPYAVEREIEDIEALADEAGGQAYLYGISSGGALALEAARALPNKIAKLAVFEVPYIVGDTRPRPPADTAKVFTEFVESGRRGDAAEHFMTKVVGMPQEFAAQARSQPWWAAQEALAHTLAYDATIMGDYTMPTDRLGQITVPTLVVDGGESWEWMRITQRALVEAIPGATYRTLEGQWHDVNASVLAPVLAEFFDSQVSSAV